MPNWNALTAAAAHRAATSVRRPIIGEEAINLMPEALPGQPRVEEAGAVAAGVAVAVAAEDKSGNHQYLRQLRAG